MTCVVLSWFIQTVQYMYSYKQCSTCKHTTCPDCTHPTQPHPHHPLAHPLLYTQTSPPTPLNIYTPYTNHIHIIYTYTHHVSEAMCCAIDNGGHSSTRPPAMSTVSLHSVDSNSASPILPAHHMLMRTNMSVGGMWCCCQWSMMRRAVVVVVVSVCLCV